MTDTMIDRGLIERVLAAHEETRIAYAGATWDVDLECVPGSNLWLQAGYRVAPRMTLLGSWDSMHLGRSNTVTLTTPAHTIAYVRQPTSDMWRVGLRAVYEL